MSISHLLLTTLILTVAIAARYLLVVVGVYALVWGRKEGPIIGRRLNRDRDCGNRCCKSRLGRR